jgi:hypothetical protein
MSITKSETKQSIPVTMSLHMRTDQEHTPRSPASSTETYTDPNTSGGRGGPPPDLWPAELSASFASIADQLQKASRTLAAHAAADQQEALRVRVDAVERAQERLAGELAALRNLHGGESCAAVLPNTAVASSSYSRSTTANLERRLADMLAAQKLEYGSRCREGKIGLLTCAFQPRPPLCPPAELACDCGKDAHNGAADRVWKATARPPED